ncbi:CvpA family protein [Acetobacterium sp.]|uniref:CvpA family protein n=1 Tax=Acetobacterium sp. TaxID=1872094 RepID=UPI002F403495
MSLTTVDFICILVCIVSGLIGYRRGAIKTLISFGGFIASFAIAWIFSSMLADWLISLGVFNGLVNMVNIEAVAQSIVNGVGQQGVFASGSVGEAILTGGQNITTESVSMITQALTWGIAYIVSFVILLLVSGIAFGILQAIFSGVSQIPIIGGINRLLGGAMGFILGLGLCVIVIWILTALNTFTGGAANLPNFEGSAISQVVTPWVTNLIVLN